MPITDLTGTTWIINNNINDFPGDSFAINFTSNGNNYTHFNPTSEAPGELIIWLLVYWDATLAGTTVYNSGTWVNDNYKTIEITGGTDATNANLISWLEANATQVIPEPTVTKIGNLSIMKKMFGSLPIVKEVLNGTTIYENGGSTPALISFTISSNSYQAEEGMTWTQWCESDYNTDGFFDDGYTIVAPTYVYAVAYNNATISSSATIVDDRAYTLKHYGG